MKDRYYIRPDSDHADWTAYHVVDSHEGGYDRNVGARYIASCPDAEMAQKIADLLNEREAEVLPAWA